MAFRSVIVPLLKGQDGASADLAVLSDAQELLAATDVVFTKSKSIKGRPGRVSQDAALTMYDGSAGGNSLSTFPYTQVALHALPGSTNVLLQGHGRGAVKGQNGWLDTGPLWSVRRQTCSTLRTIPSLTTTGLQGVSFDVTPTTSSVRVSDGTGLPGFPFLDTHGAMAGHYTPVPTHFTDNPGLATTCAVNNAVFWLGQAGDLGTLYAQIHGTFPTTTQYTIAADAVAGAPDLAHVQRVWCAWDGTNYFVAYVTNAGTIKISKVNTSGTVLGSLAYASAGPADQSVALAVDSVSGKGMLVFTNNAAASVHTRIFVLSTMADSAINVDLTPTYATAFGAIAGIFNGVGYIGFNGDVGSITHRSDVNLWTRSLTAATAAVSITDFLAGTMPAGPAVWHQYQTLFPFQLVAGRVLVGIQAFAGPTVAGIGLGPCTWAVIDVTPPAVSGVGARQPVAAGQLNGCCPVHRPGNACVLSDGSLFFGVPEGVSFTQNNVETCGLTAIKLTPQGAPSTQVDNQLILGGNVSYVYDGHQTLESNWIEKPVLTGVLGGAGGTLQAASYSFQAVWACTDATGRVTRSVPSDVFTITALAGNVLTMTASVPEITARYTFSSLVALEIYQTKANPSANDPAVLMASVAVSYSPLVPATATQNVTISLDTVATNKQLYTVGNVLSDDRVPGDRGMVTLGNRVWSADEHNLYPSHPTSTTVAVAGSLPLFRIEVPSPYGRVLGLASLDDKVGAVCENGVCIVDGPGLDDQGQGSGWSSPQRVYQIGGALMAGPRSVTSFSDGMAWVGPDGLIYALNRGLSGACIGRSVQGTPEVAGDLVYVPPATGLGLDTVTTPLLIHGAAALSTLDLVYGQWARWTGSALSLVGTGLGLWALINASPYVVSYTAATGQDLSVSFAQQIRTAPRPTADGQPLGWGRLRSVNPVFDTLGNHTLQVRALADEGRVEILNTSTAMSTAAPGTKWPFSRLPEHRCLIQRASEVEVELTATPALAEWTGLDLEVFGAPMRAPSRKRVQTPNTPPAWKANGTLVTDMGANKTVPWPVGHVAGDYALLIAGSTMSSVPGANDTLVTPAGFTLIGGIESPAASGVTAHLTLWWAVATSGAMPSPVVASSGFGGDSSCAQIVTFSGAAAVAPENPIFSALGTGTAVSMTGSTTVGDSRLIVAIVTDFDAGIVTISGWTNIDIAPVTERLDTQGALTGFGGQFQLFGLATGVKTLAGSYGLTTATLSAWAGYGGYACAVLALKPG